MQESAFQLILHAGLFVKLILLVLLGFSMASWAIILYKYDQFSVASRESISFLSAWGLISDPKVLLKKVHEMDTSPLPNLFKSVYAAPHGPVHKERVERTLKRQEAVEEEKLHAYLNFLATTGSTTPFIGLLGTVWGIVGAFRGIGSTGSASLAVVAPGIAEALITTAAGLAAAIPAVMAYNYYLNWARRLTIEMEDFSQQLNDSLAK